MTKAQKLNITEFPYTEYDSYGNQTYYEEESGYWFKNTFDDNQNEIYFENSDGYLNKFLYDELDRCNYFQNSKLGWCKLKYQDDDIIISYEDNNGNYWDITMKIPNPYRDVMYDIILASI